AHRASAAVLGGTQPGGNRGTARLPRGNCEVRHGPRAAAAAGTHHLLDRPRATAHGGTIMSTDIADLLQETIDRLTAGEQVPDGLAERAFRRHRQRRLVLGSAAATGTAVAAAAAVFVAAATTGGVPQRGGGILRAQTAAYVASRTERALTAAAHGGAIERIDVTRRSEKLDVVLAEHHGDTIVLRDGPGLSPRRTA